VSPFGDTGPWADFKASDLIHLALGGRDDELCYDPGTGWHLDLPADRAADVARVPPRASSSRSPSSPRCCSAGGRAGPATSCAIHEAVAKSTEVDLMTWVMRRSLVQRQTCATRVEGVTPHPSIVHTKTGAGDGESRTRPGETEQLIKLMASTASRRASTPRRPRSRRAGNCPRHRAEHREARPRDGSGARFVRAFTYGELPWQEAQQAALLWRAAAQAARERRWSARLASRTSCTDVEHPELGRSFRYGTSSGSRRATKWIVGRRAPLLNEDAKTWCFTRRRPPVISPDAARRRTKDFRGAARPFPLNGIRILDFTWFLASSRRHAFLSAVRRPRASGRANSHPDTRMAAMAPVGGREARDKATGPLPGVTDPNMSDSSTTRTRQAWNLAERAAPEGARDRATFGCYPMSSPKDFRRACSIAGPRLRRVARDQPDIGLRAAVGHGAQGKSGASAPSVHREFFFGPVGISGLPSRPMPAGGATRSRLDGRV